MRIFNKTDVGSVVCDNDNIICSTFNIDDSTGDLMIVEKLTIKNPKTPRIKIQKQKEKEPINCLFLVKIFSNLIAKQKK